MLRAEGLGYRHPTATSPALDGVDFELQAGQSWLVTGSTGSGKSTLARLCAGLLQRHGGGTVAGRVTIDGRDPGHLAPADRARLVGFVAQNPDDQVVTGTLGEEVAFALANTGVPLPEQEGRVVALLGELGLPVEPGRPVRALSTGQRQRLVVAAALAARPRVLVLDEPLAHLDPGGAVELLLRLRELSHRGTTVLLVEHRRALARPHVDGELRLEAGRLRGVADDLPGATTAAWRGATAAAKPEPSRAPLLELPPFNFAYGAEPVLAGATLVLRGGERVALVGPNGSGKTTLLRALCGELPGAPVPRARVVPVPQDPDLSLFCPTVREELAYAAAEHGRPADLRGLARDFDLDELLDRAPQSLSRGQRLRVALAAAVAAEPDVLLLDEPTAAQDPAHVYATMAAVHRRLPGALCFATHDLGLAQGATRVVEMSAPRAVAGAPPRPDDHGGTRVDARVGLALVALVGLLAVCLDAPATLGVLSALSALALFARPPSRRDLARGGLVALAICWSTVLSQGLFYAEHPRVALLSLGPLTLWREGVAHGLVQSLRFLAVTTAGLGLARAVPANRLYEGLLALRVPYGLAFLVATALRFVPDAAAEWATVRAARARRGKPATQRPPWRWVALEVALLGPVLARSLRRARALAESLDARGFDPSARRARRPARPLTAPEVGLLVVATGLTASVVVSRLLFLAYATGTWYHPSLRAIYALARAL